jgi:hypothetical protein
LNGGRRKAESTPAANIRVAQRVDEGNKFIASMPQETQIVFIVGIAEMLRMRLRSSQELLRSGAQRRVTPIERGR